MKEEIILEKGFKIYVYKGIISYWDIEKLYALVVRKGDGFIFEMFQNSKFIGTWKAAIDNGLAITSGLRIVKKGRGYGERLVFAVLKYLYERWNARKVYTVISEYKKYTKNFTAARNLFLKMGYVLERKGEFFYLLELSGKNYKRLMEGGIQKIERKILEKKWQTELKKFE